MLQTFYLLCFIILSMFILIAYYVPRRGGGILFLFLFPRGVMCEASAAHLVRSFKEKVI